MRIMCQLAKKLILNAIQKHQVLYSTKMTLFSAVVVEVMIRVMNNVFQKSVCIVSLHWGAKIQIKNPFGIHEVVAKLGLTKRRKNIKQSSQVQSSTWRRYILKKGGNVVATGWTNTEGFTFDSCCDFLTKKNVDLSWSNINRLYESLIKVTDQYPSIAIP